MGIEIERKFLVVNDGWKQHVKSSHVIAQGYFTNNSYQSIRVRIKDDQAFVTFKFPTDDAMKRTEYEYTIPLADGYDMLSKCEPNVIEKTRHIVEFGGMDWEVDEFVGWGGLVIAEVEFESVSQIIDLPNWIGLEVTEDFTYTNNYMAFNRLMQ